MLDSIIQSEITMTSFLICTGVSIILGIGIALISMFKTKYSQSFAVTLAVIPAVVQLIIMLVNGNIGAGIAVAGAFSLVRFRSAPGSAREIGSIFLAMATGLATGMGYVAIAGIFFVIIAGFMLLLAAAGFGKGSSGERTLRITIPESLDYDGLFDDLFEEYTDGASLEKVKMTNVGTLYELSYEIKLKTDKVPKEFIDKLRCRNGNLNIICSREAIKEAL